MTAPSVTGLLTVQDAPLFYEICGQGQPLLFIHAGVADSRMWDEQFTVFCQQYRVVRFDLRGFGQSSVPPHAFSSVLDILALLDLLDIERAHVFGISFGGKVAIDFALTHPERVETLILGVPSIGGETPSPEVEQFARQEEQLLQDGDIAGATELNLRMWVDGPRRTPDQVDPLVRQRVYAMQYHAFTVPFPEEAEELQLDPPALTRLNELRMPTLLLAGEYDLPTKIHDTAQLVSQLPQAQYHLIAGAGHILTMEQPAIVHQHVLAFLAQHEGNDTRDAEY